MIIFKKFKLNKYKCINLFFIVILSFLSSNAYSTLYHNDYFDNDSFQRGYEVDYDLAAICYGVSTVKLAADSRRDTPATAFIIDSGYNRILWNYINPNTDVLEIWDFGEAGITDGKFLFPRGICANSSGDVYVSDFGNNRIVKLYYDITKPEIRFVKNFGNDILNNPQQVALDKSGNVYVCDSGNNRIRIFNSNGDLIKTIGSSGYNPGQFQNPMGVTVSIPDTNGNSYIYVADTGNGRIQKFDSNGNFVKEFRRSEEQPLSAGYFAMDIDLFGNVYAVDSVNNLVYKFDKDLNYVMSTSGKPDSPFQNLHGVSTDKSYDASGTWFSQGQCFTIENTRAQYFDIGMDVMNTSSSTNLFYPKATENNTVEIKYRLTEYGEVTINVKDGTGTGTIRKLVVDSLEDIGWNSHIWDGKDNNGKVVPEGKYSFEIIAHDLYNEGRGNKQVFKYVPDIEVVLPSIVSVTSVSPSIVIRGMQPKIGYIVSKGSGETSAKVLMKAYKSTTMFDDTTLVRTIITDKVNDKNIVNSEVWDMKDNTGVNEALDGIYTVIITASDIAGISEPTRSPPITVDRTPSYITKVYFSPFTFTGTTTLNYTISESAEVKLEIFNSRGINLYQETVVKPPGEQVYIWDGKINANIVADGSYTFKITTKDDVGNIEKSSASTIKNRIPTSISFPDKDNDEIVDTVVIKGTGLDPNIDNNNRVDNFNTYKLYFRAGNNTYITEVELKNLDLNIWKPIPVPAINQLATDVNYPNSNVSYRSIYESTIGIWDTFKPESSDGTYTILLISEDELGSVEAKDFVKKKFDLWKFYGKLYSKDEQNTVVNGTKNGQNYVQHLDKLRMAEEPKETK